MSESGHRLSTVTATHYHSIVDPGKLYLFHARITAWQLALCCSSPIKSRFVMHSFRLRDRSHYYQSGTFTVTMWSQVQTCPLGNSSWEPLISTTISKYVIFSFSSIRSILLQPQSQSLFPHIHKLDIKLRSWLRHRLNILIHPLLPQT